MARTERLIPAPPDVVYAVLADPPRYARFVVGTQSIRRFDPRWPEVGAVFDHTLGFGPFQLRDSTIVEEVEPLRRLRMRTRMMPVGINVVEFVLTPEGDGTRVVIEEYPIEGPSSKIWSPPFDAMMHARNALLLRRLERQAVGLARQRGSQEAVGRSAAGSSG